MARRNIFFIIICLAVCLAGSAAMAATQGDGVSVRASADKKAVFIGETIRYTIDAASRRDLEVQWPVFKDGKIGDFEIKDSGRQEKKGFFGGRVYRRWYTIAGYLIGKHDLPALDVNYRRTGARDWSKKAANKIVISVVSVLPKGAKISDIRDIKGPIHLFEMPWFWIGLAAILFGLIGLGIFITKKIQERLRIRPPHEIALKELASIREFLSKSGDVKEAYFRVSGCERSYIEARFDMAAPEMTTEEFLASLHESAGLSDSQKGLLREFLEACDMVKFARYMPKQEEVDSVFDTATHFIDETKVQQAPAAGK